MSNMTCTYHCLRAFTNTNICACMYTCAPTHVFLVAGLTTKTPARTIGFTQLFPVASALPLRIDGCCCILLWHIFAWLQLADPAVPSPALSSVTWPMLAEATLGNKDSGNLHPPSVTAPCCATCSCWCSSCNQCLARILASCKACAANTPHRCPSCCCKASCGGCCDCCCCHTLDCMDAFANSA